MELLRLKERIEIALEMGESHFREFKSGYQGPSDSKTKRPIKEVCQDISKTLVAFANADGGELIVGVEDDGVITGLEYNTDLLNSLIGAPKSYVLESTPLPTTKAQIVDFNGKKVAYFSVPKGTEYVYITSDGKCLKRRDLESIPVSPESIQFERDERVSREYDRVFVDGADVTDLDSNLLSYAAKEFSKTISSEKFLQHLDLAEFDGNKLHLRRAALLLFAKNPQKWHPRSQVRIIKVKGLEVKSGKDFNVEKDEEITENILRLVEGAWDLLRPHLTETKFSSDAIFKSQVVYPELACREALINAIAHRDYSIEGRGIEIFVFDDRLEIKSPGVLLSSISITDIENRTGTHQSRNTYIARVLREIGYMRELGEGFRRIYDLMESNDLKAPSLSSSNKSFVVSLSQKLVYTPEEKLWLENFSDIDLSREEKTVVRLGAKGELISPKLIWDTVGIVDTDAYRQLLESLRQKGILSSDVSKPQAMSIARKKKIKDKKAIPRFRIIAPSKDSVSPKRLPKKEILDTEPLSNSFDDSDYAKIFIENIPFDCSEEDLENLFSKYGEISSIQIPKSYYTGKSRGFAFIEFDKKSSVQAALKDKFNIYLNSRKIIVKEFEVKRPAHNIV
ncbi:putative DNA binding domain-containing protein [Candidatus Nomurabacteria bacterium]|nr:putative DNA binding domain-containing protein [Candidatus Nomurabacteria bacterium]